MTIIIRGISTVMIVRGAENLHPRRVRLSFAFGLCRMLLYIRLRSRT